MNGVKGKRKNPHAEVMCIRNFIRNMKRKNIKTRKCRRMTLIVVRIPLGCDEDFTESSPCEECVKFIKKQRFIKTVVSSNCYTEVNKFKSYRNT
jgi:hypothetical protein